MTRARATSPRREPWIAQRGKPPAQTRNAAPDRMTPDINVPAVRPGWDITLDLSAATFLPDPIKAHAELLAPFRRARGPSHDRDFPALLVGDIAPIAAYVTAALRHDLPTLNALDAKVIWQRWRQAVAVIRGVLAIEASSRAYPEVGLLDSDLSLLLRGLRRALAHPGSLARDVSFPSAVAQRDPSARRNRQQAMPYVGGGVPDFRPSKRAAAMFAGLSLLPKPSATVEALWQRYRDANGPDDASHEDPPAPLLAVRDLIAIANFITAELRRELPSVFVQDAAVVWKKWRDVALDLRVEIRGRDPHEWSTYRAFPLRVERLARDLETARSAPGKLFDSFCPWREAYFTRDELRPDQRGGNWRKSRLEVNAWVPS